MYDLESLAKLREQRAQLDAQIAETMRQHRSAALQQIKTLAMEFGLTGQDLMRAVGGGFSPRPSVSSRPAMFRDPVTGNTWSGRGKRPEWLRKALTDGKQLSDFSISSTAQTAAPEPPAPPADPVVFKPAPTKAGAKQVVKGKPAAKKR